ncbi:MULTISPECIES: alpha/beta fold hydrolase [Halorussus]|uniref:alpha/beta fold hydrolase n=1 Tax=Halorussus TaxID=1070314 RepID=UPI000E213A04|nr:MULTISPECIES: alpha/beta hydrolase [Halorussus]NHN57831.1 alpha/beta fold hydrolase [Halorussus sp. JP-T4]
MPYADNEGVSLYYELAGPETGDVVALVEGLGYGRWMWRWQRDRLVDEGYRVVVWDNRGTGDSDEPEGPYTIAEMASDLEAVLDAVGVARAHVVGASMGGMIAQQYALDYDRAASLGLLCTSPGGDDAVPTPEETQARMFDAPGDADEREALRYKMQPAMTDEFWAENQDLIEDIVDWRLAGDASDAAREAQAAGVAAFDSSDRLDEIDVPVLVAHGTDDRVLPVENADLLYEGLPNARLAVFEGGPHLFFIERAEAVNDRLAEFLAHV